MSDHKTALAILELGMDIIILNKRALIKKILALHEGTAWDFTRFPLLIDVDKNSPSICSEEKVLEISRILYTAFRGNEKLIVLSEESITQCALLYYEEVEREVSLPLVAGWLIGYPVCYRSTGDGQALSMQRLEKTTLSVVLEDDDTNLVVMEFTAPLCTVSEEDKRRLKCSVDARVEEIIAVTIVEQAKVDRSVEICTSVVL